MNAEQERERPSSHVVGRVAHGVALHLEQVLDVGSVGLAARDHDRSGGPGAVVSSDLLIGDRELDAGANEDVRQARDGPGVAVVGGQDPGPRDPFAALVDGAPGRIRRVLQPQWRLAREAREQGAAEGQFVAHDVADAPPPSGPGVGETIRGSVGTEPTGSRELGDGQEDR